MIFLETQPTRYLNTQYLVVAMLVLLAVLFSVVLFMLVYLVNRKNEEKQKKKWRSNVMLLIRRAVFFEETMENNEILVGPKVKRWLCAQAFRKFLLDEMIEAKKNFTGDAAANLVKLYNQLDLKKTSIARLGSLKWHIKARGIQELAMMDQKDQVSRIYRLTNHSNQFVRMEAQSAIVSFYGFEGLRFLDVVTQPLSDWQQIKLLAQLPRTSTVLLEGIEGWLKSSNDSVVLFALRLAGIQHRFELHDPIVACLAHRDSAVRIQAIKGLQDICNETTAGEILRLYDQADPHYQLTALEALQSIGSDQQIGFLQKELLRDDDSIKLAAARALAAISNGNLTEIIRQAKGEKAA